MKQLLKQIWKAEAEASEANRTACRYQTLCGSRTETWVCSRAVFYDYAPEEELEPNKQFKVDDLPLKELRDPERTYAENMFYSGVILLEDYSLLDCLFLNAGLPELGQSISVFDRNGETGYYRCGLPWGNETSFQWVRKLLYDIPEPVKNLIKDTVTLQELNASFVRLKATPDIAILLGAENAWLVVPMARIKSYELVNEQLFINGIQYRLDGLDQETQTFTRLVEVHTKQMTMRGLANPTKAAQASAAQAPRVVPMPEPAGSPGDSVTVEELKQAQEPQVEEVQPEQAQEIAQQAPEVTQEKEQQQTDTTEEEAKKRTRIRKTPTAANPANAKALDEVITYLGSPVSDTMSLEDIDEEIRKCRDLGIVISRRMANLYAAGSLIPKKKLAAVMEVLK